MRPALAALALAIPGSAHLFFSEYADGKTQYLEIYNSGESPEISCEVCGGVVNLAAYGLEIGRKKGHGPLAYAFPMGTFVQAGNVFVVCDPSSKPAVLAQCDQLHNFGSDDGANYCLVSSSPTNKFVYDCVGEDAAVAGAGWDVCGESATKGATLVRKSTVTEGALWVDSTAVETCEWYRLPQETFTYVGSHPHPELGLSPTPGSPAVKAAHSLKLGVATTRIAGLPTPPALAPAADLVLTPQPTLLPLPPAVDVPAPGMAPEPTPAVEDPAVVPPEIPGLVPTLTPTLMPTAQSDGGADVQFYDRDFVRDAHAAPDVAAPDAGPDARTDHADGRANVQFYYRDSVRDAHVTSDDTAPDAWPDARTDDHADGSADAQFYRNYVCDAHVAPDAESDAGPDGHADA
ncbi:hypothetical protein M885DRAFT_623452 [Pelagophyceae sp. CCMP2097]|nr:hypothetical protein M885DRAFT_623452 [Pelagophyceae sp. CCMP2097]